ncbi:diguanylate cyclase [Candidatus Scalindua japonica]|uniref:diguanylate cyclase n=1 Tax=Candidatus Scalindua japonica TaxID=1284222 RepID=A0A286U3T8_9BACT|nr:diguanylate cyclase [Candidatus Scalindua japonica]GAX62784.1 diguanylate cyclase [Candidatus Scalindua japonica]
METIRNLVLSCLDEFSIDDDKLIAELNCIIDKFGDEVCPVIFSVLTHLDLTPDQAKDYWKQVVSHRKSMSESLGWGVNLRTAICDYFCTINKSMKNPIIIEICVLEDALYSLRYDSLTGLHSRRTFDEIFLRETERANRYGQELSILFFDIDDFKKVNDAFGHLAGDSALEHVARIVIGGIRAIDIAARYGGEEIVVILPQTGKADAFVVGERIREKVENTKFDYKGQLINLTISGGVATLPIDATDAECLLKNADIAVYKAKEAGKNNVVIYSENRRRFIRVDFITDLRVKEVYSEENIVAGETKSSDLSAGGLLFKSDYSIDIGTKVQLQIPTGISDNPLLIIGTVVRVEKFNSNQLDIGISFIEVDNAVKNDLSKYIRKCICEKKTLDKKVNNKQL